MKSAASDAETPILSVVIVDSDGCADTLNCLQSIYSHPPAAPFEIILVDNCSKQSCLPVVEQRFPIVRVFTAPQRQGFARNYNLGLRQAVGDYLLVLNNDTLVQPGALDALLAEARAHPAYALTGSRLRGRDGRLQSFCARPLMTPGQYILRLLVLDLGTPIGQLWECWLASRLERRPSGPVPCISGACMLVSQQALEQIGLLDEGYDFYFEDVEWCHRAWKHGWQVGFAARAEIIHLGDQSLSKVKVWAKQSEYRSAQRYFTQYYRLTRVYKQWIKTAAWLSYLLRWLIFTLKGRISDGSGYAADYKKLLLWVMNEKGV